VVTGAGRQGGLTVIELMVMAAFVSIVAALALPVYRDYTIRGRIAEAILATSQCRTAIAETYRSAPRGTSVRADGWACGEGLTTTHIVASIATDPDGAITVTTASSKALGAAANATLTLVPVKVDGTRLATTDIPAKVFAFRCGPGGPRPIDAKYLPDSCRG